MSGFKPIFGGFLQFPTYAYVSVTQRFPKFRLLGMFSTSSTILATFSYTSWPHQRGQPDGLQGDAEIAPKAQIWRQHVEL